MRSVASVRYPHAFACEITLFVIISFGLASRCVVVVMGDSSILVHVVFRLEELRVPLDNLTQMDL